jgi:adenosylmethionine---8-amino-7-oxononanoate aminotransferase
MTRAKGDSRPEADPMTGGGGPRAEGRELLVAWDDAHVWHPFTPHSVYRDEAPLMVVAGEGNYLVDADGTRYLDAVASLWCNLFGHRRPEIDAAIADQLGRIAHSTFLGNASAPAVALAKRLVDVAPEGLTRVFFSDNGSTAVEVALKMAYQYWQQADGGAHARRTAFLTLANAYHGDTVGSVSVGGIELFHEVYRPLLFEAVRAPSPYTYRCPCGKPRAECEEDATARVVAAVEEHGPRLAAVILEPGVQGAAGMLTQPPGFVRRVAEAARRAGTLLILDEVAVGFGRSGSMFACEREDAAPDFLCLAKGLTGGYLPMAATLTTERVFEAFLGEPSLGRTFYHGHTYTGNQLAAAAAHAVLDIFEKDDVVASLGPKVERLGAELARLGAHPNVGEVRQYGLAAGVELVADRATKEAFPASERRGMRVCTAARSRGVFLRPLGDTIILMPPLTITDAEIVAIVDAVEYGLAAVCGPAQ